MSEGWRVPAYSRPVRYRSERSWMTGADEVQARAAGPSGEEARAMRESANETPSGTILARAGDLERCPDILAGAAHGGCLLIRWTLDRTPLDRVGEQAYVTAGAGRMSVKGGEYERRHGCQ
jgi:hypothetical protein